MLKNTDVIDLIADDDKRVVLCLVVESGEWNLPQALSLLQEKVYRYADYAQGALQEQYPDTAGKDISIRIQPVDVPPASVATLIPKLAGVMRAEGMSLSLQPLSQAAA